MTTPVHTADPAVATVEAQVAMLLRLAEHSRRSAVRTPGSLERSSYLVLGTLAARGPANVNAIATALRLDPSTVTRQVLAMEAAGHAARTPDPHDGRGIVVSATPAGVAALQATRESRGVMYAEILQDWTPEERALLAGMLTRFNADVDEYGRRHQGSSRA
ncbi:MarR family winged helix-turn-helix transcriptional regulator [Cellulomonas hominis]